jgi:hypothetical protein
MAKYNRNFVCDRDLVRMSPRALRKYYKASLEDIDHSRIHTRYVGTYLCRERRFYCTAISGMRSTRLATIERSNMHKTLKVPADRSF